MQQHMQAKAAVWDVWFIWSLRLTVAVERVKVRGLEFGGFGAQVGHVDV
jgi:hypothetical protein